MRQIVTGPQVVEWVAKRTNEFGDFGAAVGIGLAKDGEIVGGVVLNEYNGVNINVHIASDESKMWMNKEFLWYVFHYAFEEANVNRMTALIGEGNKAAIHLNTRMGFKHEAAIEGAHPTGKMLILGMFKQDCKWLNIKRGSEYEQKQNT